MTYRILLCDDEFPILRAAEFKLARAGHEVRTASDGEEAWQAAQEQIPDIVVTDYQMPRLDGLGLVQRLRDNPATRHLPVLMLTAKGFELNHDELAEKWKISAVLAKPFSPRELLEKVRALLEQTGAAAGVEG